MSHSYKRPAHKHPGYPVRGRSLKRGFSGAPPRRARGVAMLVAIMLVALATIIAATIGYESAVAARRATGTYAFDQSILIAEGAEGLAAYALKQVWQNAGSGGRTINPTQAWAQPVGPLEIVPGVNLDAQMEDLAGRFNVNRLVMSDGKGGAVADPEAERAFVALLTELGIETPQRWASLLIDWIDPDSNPSPPEGAEDSLYLSQAPPYLAANRYITSITELLALPGFGEANYQALAPYITALPPDSMINICTAPPQVLDALLGLNRTDYSSEGETFYKSRAAANGCYPTIDEYTQKYNQAHPTATPTNATPPPGGSTTPTGGPPQGRAAQGPVPTTTGGLTKPYNNISSYFRLTSHIATGDGTEFNIYSLIYQDPSQGTARPILRSFTPD